MPVSFTYSFHFKLYPGVWLIVTVTVKTGSSTRYIDYRPSQYPFHLSVSDSGAFQTDFHFHSQCNNIFSLVCLTDWDEGILIPSDFNWFIIIIILSYRILLCLSPVLVCTLKIPASSELLFDIFEYWREGWMILNGIEL